MVAKWQSGYSHAIFYKSRPPRRNGFGWRFDNDGGGQGQRGGGAGGGEGGEREEEEDEKKDEEEKDKRRHIDNDVDGRPFPGQPRLTISSKDLIKRCRLPLMTSSICH